MAEYSSSTGTTPLRRYVHGPGVDEPIVIYDGGTTTTKRWSYRNGQGSIIAEADGSGRATAIYTYGPYGEPEDTAGALFRYTGQLLDAETGLYYDKARYYSPSLGRFLQTDPIGYQDDLNLLNLRDSTGQAAETVLDVTSLIVGGVSFADNVSKGSVGAALLDAAGIVVDAVAVAVPFVPGGASLGIKLIREGGEAAGNAANAVNKVKQQKQLASESQMSRLRDGRGDVIAGGDSGVPFRDAEKIANEIGGGTQASDFVKVKSDAFTTSDGMILSTHAVRNNKNGDIIQEKSIIDERARNQ